MKQMHLPGGRGRNEVRRGSRSSSRQAATQNYRAPPTAPRKLSGIQKKNNVVSQGPFPLTYVVSFFKRRAKEGGAGCVPAH